MAAFRVSKVLNLRQKQVTHVTDEHTHIHIYIIYIYLCIHNYNYIYIYVYIHTHPAPFLRCVATEAFMLLFFFLIMSKNTHFEACGLPTKAESIRRDWKMSPKVSRIAGVSGNGTFLESP